jgi:DNA polymerase III alpha subunit
MQFDLFSHPERRPRIYTAALTRFGILRLDRAAAAPEGSRVHTVGLIQALSGLVTRGGRRLAVARLEDGEGGVDLLLLPAILDAGEDVPLGRPVVVNGRVSMREGRSEIIVESVIPLELLAQVVQPALELALPVGFRRLRSLKLRLMRSPGRSPVLIVPAPGLRAAVESAGIARLGVTPDENLIADLKSFVGEDNVRLIEPGRGREMESIAAEETRAGAA